MESTVDCEAIRNITNTYPLNHWSMNTMDYPPFLTAFPIGKGSSIPMLDYEKKVFIQYRHQPIQAHM